MQKARAAKLAAGQDLTTDSQWEVRISLRFSRVFSFSLSFFFVRRRDATRRLHLFLHSWSKSPVQKRMFGRLTIVKRCSFYDYTVGRLHWRRPGRRKGGRTRSQEGGQGGQVKTPPSRRSHSSKHHSSVLISHIHTITLMNAVKVYRRDKQLDAFVLAFAFLSTRHPNIHASLRLYGFCLKTHDD